MDIVVGCIACRIAPGSCHFLLSKAIGSSLLCSVEYVAVDMLQLQQWVCILRGSLAPSKYGTSISR